MRPLAPDFKTYIFGILAQFVTIWHQQKRWVFFSITDPFRTHVNVYLVARINKMTGGKILLPDLKIRNEWIFEFLSKTIKLQSFIKCEAIKLSCINSTAENLFVFISWNLKSHQISFLWLNLCFRPRVHNLPQWH